MIELANVVAAFDAPVSITKQRYSVKVLEDCIQLQNKKSQDYQNSVSSVKQADYYPHGITTIYDIMWAKMLRIKSVMDVMKSGGKQNFESLGDSAMDLINYSSFFVAYLEGNVDGQKSDNNCFNEPS